MNRIAATRKIVSRNFASRPVRAAVAVKIAFAIMAANVSFAAAKAVFHRTDAAAPAISASASSVKPFIIPVGERVETPQQATSVAAAQGCHEVVVEIDEGYGVRGTVTRTVCRKAL